MGLRGYQFKTNFKQNSFIQFSGTTCFKVVKEKTNSIICENGLRQYELTLEVLHQAMTHAAAFARS